MSQVADETETTAGTAHDTAAADSQQIYLEVVRVNEHTGDIIARQDPAYPRVPIKVGQRVHIDGEPCRVRRLTGELVILTPLKEVQVVRGKAAPKEKEVDASRGLRAARRAAQDRALKRQRHAKKMKAQEKAARLGTRIENEPNAAKAAGGAS
jgi:hypothetical protein